MNKNQIWANETRASASGVAGAARPEASVSRMDDVGTSRPEATWATRAGCPTTGLSPQAALAAPSGDLPGSSSHSEGPRPAPGRQTPPRWGALMKAAGSAPDPSALAGAFTEHAAVTYTEAGVCDAHPASRGNLGHPAPTGSRTRRSRGHGLWSLLDAACVLDAQGGWLPHATSSGWHCSHATGAQCGWLLPA